MVTLVIVMAIWLLLLTGAIVGMLFRVNAMDEQLRLLALAESRRLHFDTDQLKP